MKEFEPTGFRAWWLSSFWQQFQDGILKPEVSACRLQTCLVTENVSKNAIQTFLLSIVTVLIPCDVPFDERDVDRQQKQ